MTRGIHRSQPDLRLLARRDTFAPGKHSFLLVTCLCIALVLSGCSFDKPESSSGRGKAPAPAAIASGAERVGTTSALPQPMDTFRAIAKPQGLKFTPLFAVPIDDANARMKRVEDAVQLLRNDFDSVVPSMVRLVAIEKDMKELVSQLQSLTGDPASAPVDEVEQTEIPIPGEDVAEGTEPAEVLVKAPAGTATPTSPVTPEAAPQGMPPEGAASPIQAPAGEIVAVEAAPQETPQEAAPAAPPVAPEAPQEEPAGVAPTPAPAAPAPPVTAAPETSVEWSAPYGMKTPDPAPLKPVAPAPATPAPAAQAPAPVAPAPAASEPTTPIKITPQQQPAPAASTTSAQPVPPPAPAPVQEAKAEVLAIRIADHPDKTRIVMDVSKQASLKAGISADGKQLVVDVAGLSWKEKASWLADSGVLAAGWTYANGKLYIDLIYPSTLKAQQVLPPNGTPYYRFVLDVFSKDVHQ